MSSNLKALMFSALALSIGADVGFAFVLYHLASWHIIVPDDKNLIEFGIAIFISILTLVALGLLARNMIKEKK